MFHVEHFCRKRAQAKIVDWPVKTRIQDHCSTWNNGGGCEGLANVPRGTFTHTKMRKCVSVPAVILARKENVRFLADFEGGDFEVVTKLAQK